MAKSAPAPSRIWSHGLQNRRLGDAEREEEQWRRVVEERPGYCPGWRGLGDVLVRRGKMAEARSVAERLLENKRLHGEGRLLLCTLAAASGDDAGARRELEQAVAADPDDVAPLEALCRLFFERGQPAEAERALQELVRRCPDDAAAWHNLGTIYLRVRRPAEAIGAYRESLRHRPDAADTHLHLGYALKEVGRLDEAVVAWEAAVRLEPRNHQARDQLRQVRGTGQG
ncbi:MAG TPA: tetratricopeptide repeat protein [Gemmataceae bacterium]|nr:tetratricopeptide repeat protein [Gemmataceae bacterium]